MVEGLWEAVRGRIDDTQGKGLFLLTGLVEPEKGDRLHTGARRIAPVPMRTIARNSDRPVSESTLHDYLGALRRLFLIEDQESWKPELRSRIRLVATPKRHLADPSLAVAALDATPNRLLGPEIELAGFLFESQVVHDPIPRTNSATQLGSHVLPPSSEKDCSKRKVVSVISEKMKRTKTARPLKSSWL